MYGWTPDYLLDGLTFEQVMMYHRHGIAFEETKAQIMVAAIGKAMGNNETETKTSAKAPRKYKEFKDQTPDRAGFAKFGGIKHG